MRGKIRWFSEEQEGGFLLGDDGVERFLDAEDVTGSTPPRGGDVVEFEHRDTSDGARAVNVKIVSRSEDPDRPSYGQVTCGVCKQTMVPRYVPDSVYPQLGYFACIYCGFMFKHRNPTGNSPMQENHRLRHIIPAVLAGIVAVVAIVAAVLYLTRDTDAESLAERHIRIGDEAMQHENYDRAVWAYTEYINLFPSDPMGYAMRGAAHNEDGEYNEAIEDFDRAIALDPDDSAFYVGRGRAHVGAGFMNRGIEEYNLALTIDSDNADAYNYRGVVHWYQSKDDMAEADFTTAIQARPDFVRAILNRGHVRLKTMDFAGAVEDYSKVIEIDPNHPVGYAVRGEAYIGLKQFDKALPDLNRAIATAVENSYLYIMRGQAYYGVEDLENAVRDFDRALELDPCHVDHHLPLQAALEAYTDLIEREPDNAEAYLNRALVRAKMGQITRSKFDFQHAIDRDPDLAAAYYFRAYFTAYYPVMSQEEPSPGASEQFKQDLKKVRELEYVPGDNMSECRQIIARFRQLQS